MPCAAALRRTSRGKNLAGSTPHAACAQHSAAVQHPPDRSDRRDHTRRQRPACGPDALAAHSIVVEKVLREAKVNASASASHLSKEFARWRLAKRIYSQNGFQVGSGVNLR